MRSLLPPESVALGTGSVPRGVRLRALFADSWLRGTSTTFADRIYVALAQHLGAPLLTDDYKLANAPDLPVGILLLSR